MCTLKNDKCSPTSKGCSLEVIQATNKENGAPSPSTYNDEVNELKVSKALRTVLVFNIGFAVPTFFLYVVFRKCNKSKYEKLKKNYFVIFLIKIKKIKKKV